MAQIGGHVVAEHLADRLDLLDVADRRRGGVRVDVVDLADALAVEPSAPCACSAPRLRRTAHHVEAVGRRAVADDLAIDLGAARLGVLEFLEHQDAGAAGDDEAVAVLVVGAARDLGGVALYSDDMAPMASNRTDSVQSSSSQPPANMMSCLPHWISSAALPMQCAEVAQAEEIE